MELEVAGDRQVRWGAAFSVPAPGTNGRAVAVFRPDEVRVDPGGLKSRVEVMVFLGGTMRVHVEAAGIRVAVDLPARQATHLSVGDVLCIRVPDSAVQVFPAD